MPLRFGWLAPIRDGSTFFYAQTICYYTSLLYQVARRVMHDPSPPGETLHGYFEEKEAGNENSQAYGH